MLVADPNRKVTASAALSGVTNREAGASGRSASELTWSAILECGQGVAAIGPSFAGTQLASATHSARCFSSIPQSAEAWRKVATDSNGATLIFVDHPIWDQPQFVQDGLPQLCHALAYGGHFVWVGGPALWPRRAQTRAAILRLCSLHGLTLLGQIRVPAAGPSSPALRGWMLERRDPVKTLTGA